MTRSTAGLLVLNLGNPEGVAIPPSNLYEAMDMDMSSPINWIMFLNKEPLIWSPVEFRQSRSQARLAGSCKTTPGDILDHECNINQELSVVFKGVESASDDDSRLFLSASELPHLPPLRLMITCWSLKDTLRQLSSRTRNSFSAFDAICFLLFSLGQPSWVHQASPHQQNID